MLGSIATKIAIALLKFNLSKSDRMKLTNAILQSLGAIQSSEIISWDSRGVLSVQGREIDMETAKVLRESARLLINSPARKLVRGQVEYKATTVGVRQAELPEQMMFGKSAIWWGQEEDKLYQLLAQSEDDRELDP